MLYPRVYHTLITLADGQVLAVGGESTSDQSVVTTGVMPTEIWDPVSQTWSSAAPISAARNYHSTAVLLPDGTVLSAGGGHYDGLNNAAEENAQIYSPSYLFNGPRPTITSAPSSATYGSTISVATPDASSITAVNLVSLGTDTHQIDMNQHFVPLSFTAGNDSLNVTMPSSAADAPPGHYMLFIVNSSGTPSVASIIGLNPSTAPAAPAAPTGVTATAGNGSATVSWTAPSDGNSPITSYTITPSTGSTTLTPTVITGNPPATSAMITGLANGTAYTFTVTATNSVGTGPASAASNSVTPVAPTAPTAPTGVTATAGQWLCHRVLDGARQRGQPDNQLHRHALYRHHSADSDNGDRNAAGGNRHAHRADQWDCVHVQRGRDEQRRHQPGVRRVERRHTICFPVPAFVQQASTHASGVSTLAVTPSAPLGTGNRLVVEVGVWSGSAATTSSVTDTAGDTFTEVSHFTGPDKTEQSIWTAPVTAGAGNIPTVTAKFTSAADAAITALEYSGLSSAAGSAAVDQQATASGTTATAGTVSSGATSPTGAGNELAVGSYSDSGFGDTLTAESGYMSRTNISKTGDMELLAEDQVVGAGATPSAGAGTGAKTIWEMAIVVFKAGSQAPPTAPAAPANVTATAGDQSAVVSWTAPANGGSAITSYTVTPYVGSTAQTPTVITGNPPAMTAAVTGLTDGTAYTFTVSATNGVGTGPASAASNSVTPVAPTAPAAPTGVSATAGNQSATVTWTAPPNGGSPITMYTVTPYLAGVPQTPTLVSGSPPATTATVSGLTNGSSYTFTVSATNAIGAGPASAQSQSVTPVATVAPAFVQQASAHGSALTSISATMPAAVTNGHRLVVEVADWSSGHATVSSVTDSAGDTFTELTAATGPDGTQLSVWTAPITASGGTKPTIVAKPSAKADMGLAVLEYSGLSTAAGVGAVDQIATATGTTSTARAVSSGSTAATTARNELAVGFYADSGFGDALTGDPGYTSRVNMSPEGDMEFLVEDDMVGQAATPAPSVTTGASTIWEMATVVFKS